MAHQVTLPPAAQPHADGAIAGGWWHDTSKAGEIICDLCPRACQLKPGDRGFCFVRENRDGEMALTTYGRSTGFCIDPIEKKPLNHFYPGTSVLSFGTAGCNLGCKFCQNWDISKSREIERLSDQASPEGIAAAAKHHDCHSVAFTYNDPVIWAEYAIDVARACHEVGIRTVAVTAGYITPVARQPFFEVMDAANVDLKAFTEEFYQHLTLSHLQPVLDTLRWLQTESNVWFEITNLIIPRANDSADEIRQMCDWILDNLGDKVPIHFTAFHPDFRLQDRPATPHETLLMAFDIARQQGLRYVYVGNVHDSSHDSTFCHECGELLIERDWHQLGAYHMERDKCQFCKTVIPGRFADAPGNWGRRRQPVRMADFEKNVIPIGSVENKGNGGAPCGTTSPQKENAGQATHTQASSPPEHLTPRQKQQTHRAACHLLSAAVCGAEPELPDEALDGAAEKLVMGAFVTVKRQGRLRGCCGVLGQSMPLMAALQQAARRTAREDVRMPPVSPGELPFLELDVSLLHGFRSVTAKGQERIRQIEIGRHGLQIRRGNASGLLLPNVATEHGLDAEQFLRQVCRKAGLPTTAWAADDTGLVLFESHFLEGAFDPRALDCYGLAEKPVYNAEELQHLAEHCRANVVAHLRGATPSYYLDGCPDAMVHGAGLSIRSSVDDPPIHVSKISLRPAIPLQATLQNLASLAADVIRQRAAPESLSVGVTILSDPTMQGTAAEPDLRGIEPAGRALLVQENGCSSWRIDPSADAAELLDKTTQAARLATPATANLYSLSFQTTERTMAVNGAPQPQTVSDTRPPAVAGSFYPGNPSELSQIVEGLLEKQSPSTEDWPAALVPHAGLRYSGRIAASVLQRINIPPTVVILGPKHTRFGVPWAVAPHRQWSIPGATFDSDVVLSQRLADEVEGWELDAAAHRDEHAIEVELPLLARLAPHVKIVGVAIGPADLDRCRKFAEGLAGVLREMTPRPLLLVSSDMNHFANLEENHRLDRLAIEALTHLDAEHVYRTVTGHHISMCGVLPAVTVLETLRLLGGADTCQEVAYGTSADVTGDTSRVVGYAGLLFR